MHPYVSEHGLIRRPSFVRSSSRAEVEEPAKSGIQYPLAQVLEGFEEAPHSVFNPSPASPVKPPKILKSLSNESATVKQYFEHVSPAAKKFHKSRGHFSIPDYELSNQDLLKISGTYSLCAALICGLGFLFYSLKATN